MVLSVPCGQTAEIVADGVEDGHFLRVDKHANVCLGVKQLVLPIAQSVDDNAVQRLRRQRTIAVRLSVRLFGCKLHLPVQHVATEKVVIIQKLLYCEHSQF